MNSLVVALVVHLACFASSVRLDPTPGMAVTSPDWMSYDNGTPSWITWNGTYRGVWFNLHDFLPGAYRVCIQQAELWFWHHTSYPWDISDFYVELWNGDAAGPTTILNKSQMTAMHYAPCIYIYQIGYYHIHSEDNNFWCLANTEMSSGGWPSSLSDAEHGPIHHSFYSDDFTNWEPWTAQPWDEDGACNYFIRVYVDPSCWESSFDQTSWGSLKALF